MSQLSTVTLGWRIDTAWQFDSLTSAFSNMSKFQIAQLGWAPHLRTLGIELHFEDVPESCGLILAVAFEHGLEDYLSKPCSKLDEALVDFHLSQCRLSLHLPSEWTRSDGRLTALLERAFPGLCERKMLRVVVLGGKFTRSLYQRYVDRPVGKPLSMVKGHPGPVRAIAVSANSRWVATGCEEEVIILWETHGHFGQAAHAWHGVSPSSQSLAFSSDGDRLAFPDPYRAAIIIRDTAKGDLLATLRMRSNMQGDLVGLNRCCVCTWSPDNARLVAVHWMSGNTSRTSVYVWDAETYTVLHTIAGDDPTLFAKLSEGDQAKISWPAVSFSSDGLRVLRASRTQQQWDLTSIKYALQADVWDVATGTHLWNFTGTVLRRGTGLVRCTAVLGPEATHFAAWFCDSVVQLWDVQRETVLTLDHECGVNTREQYLAFASTGHRLLSWGKRRTSLKL